MSDSNPISVRLTEEEKERLKSIGDEGTLASGIRKLLELHASSPLVNRSKEDELRLIEDEIKTLKKSPFISNKKDIVALEKLLEETRLKISSSQTDSIKNRLLKLMKSSG